jgi:hypothetical protein
MIFADFSEALISEPPTIELAQSLRLYGQFVGAWSMDATFFLEDGETKTGVGEIHFSWILGGTAVGDTWVLPGIFHGCAIRSYDSKMDAWHIMWTSPKTNTVFRMLGRSVGNEIVQTVTTEDGVSVRWLFTDISSDAFTWIGSRKKSAGEDLRVYAEAKARRI